MRQGWLGRVGVGGVRVGWVGSQDGLGRVGQGRSGWDGSGW